MPTGTSHKVSEGCALDYRLLRWDYPASHSTNHSTPEAPAPAIRLLCVTYATLTTFTEPLFHSMADGLPGPERAPGPGRR
jgi:hypothetical protein